jgi:hypothetical protein
MPITNAAISVPQSDDLDVRATFTLVPTGQAVSDAYLTVTNASGTGHLFQKHITSTLVAGQGHITDTGAGDGEAAVWFQLTGGTTAVPGNTTLLVVGTAYFFDIQVNTDQGKRYTPVSGTITGTQQATEDV